MQCEEAETCLRRNDMRGLYSNIKDIVGTVELRNQTVRDKEGRIIDDDKGKLARWKEYFSQLFNVNTSVDRTVMDDLVGTNDDGSEMPDYMGGSEVCTTVSKEKEGTWNRWHHSRATTSWR